MDEDLQDIGKLELLSVIGFNGTIPGGLTAHPDRFNLVYALGCTIVIENIDSHQQTFLHGHTSDVVCLTISKTGRFIASGQVTHMGYKADIIVWDYQSGTEFARFVLHKVKVQSLAFSPNEKYLVSLGGQDDGSVVVWSLAKKEAICGSPAQHQSAGNCNSLAYSNNSDDIFVTAGENTLRVWNLDLENRKIRPTDVAMGHIKRVINCIVISMDDNSIYCGTTTGDVLGINMKTYLFQHYGPEKDKFSLGVVSLRLMHNGDFMVGAGDGTVNLMKQVEKKENLKVVKKFIRTSSSFKAMGGVTSIALRGQGQYFYIGTDKGHVYQITLADMTADLILTSHTSAVNDVCFPRNCSDLFVTCSCEDIRVFHTPSQKELLRINIPNMICYTLDLLSDGSGIISGWSDSVIRGFFPESGRQMFAIENAHKKGVTALAVTSAGNRIVSGGGEGQVRVWQLRDVTPHVPRGGLNYKSFAERKKAQNQERKFVTEMIAAMKEHTNSVTSIRVNHDDTKCVSSSSDGTCIVWCLQNFSRKQIIFANTLFRCVCYQPDEVQIITSGTDRKVGYWELLDGQLVRELDASKSGAINGMDITADGDCFVTVGDDKFLKLWKYNEGEVTHVGIGHSTAITRVRICPNRRIIISVGTDGAVYLWKFPH